MTAFAPFVSSATVAVRSIRASKRPSRPLQGVKRICKRVLSGVWKASLTETDPQKAKDHHE